MAGTIDVEFVFIDGDKCFEFNRTHRLTPNDTVSGLVSAFNPNDTRGYFYAFAKQPFVGLAVSFNWLTGTSTILSPLAGDYTVEPFSFRAPGAQGTLTDVDADGERDLDGIEYEACGDELFIPRFHGQAAPITQSQLVLIDLTGGREFVARVNLFIFDDNENAFSADYVFNCWDKVALGNISGSFNNAFLQGSDDPTEPVGAPAIENGWLRIDGHSANSGFCSVPDPAIVAILIEGVGSSRSASLPFVSGLQNNGSLINSDPFAGDCESPPPGRPALMLR
jgi:hypothetical protein